MVQPQINLPKPSPSPRRAFNLHPAYGLTDEFRLRVLTYASATSVAEAAAHFNLHISTIYNWLKALNT